MEMWSKKGGRIFKRHPKSIKIEPGAVRGRIFQILGGFWRRLIFDEFLGHVQVGQKSKKSGLWRPKTKFAHIRGRPGGMRGAAGEVRRGWTPPDSAGNCRKTHFWFGGGEGELGKGFGKGFSEKERRRENLVQSPRHAPREGRRTDWRPPAGGAPPPPFWSPAFVDRGLGTARSWHHP